MTELDSVDGDGGAIKHQVLKDINHRFRNSFQSLISYIGVMYGSRESVSQVEIQKLVRFVHAISALHTIGLGEVSEGEIGNRVRLDHLIGSVIQLNASEKTIEVNLIPELRGTYRQAASLGLVLNELLDNAVRHGEEFIKVTILPAAAGGASITVSNGVTSESYIGPSSNGTGLRLVELLAKNDLLSEPVIRREAGCFDVTITIPPW